MLFRSSCNIILSSCVYRVQDCFATIPPYPHYLGDPEEFNLSLQLDEVIYGRPIEFYSAKLSSKLRSFSDADTSCDYTIDIVYFSAMEPLDLPQRNPMQSEAGFKLLYEPGPCPPLEPVLHIGYVSNILCRVPLVPCYLDGNEHPTIPYSMRSSHSMKGKFPLGRADTKDRRGNGSRVYEVNMWLWKIGRAVPRGKSLEYEDSQAKSKRKECSTKGWRARKRSASGAALSAAALDGEVNSEDEPE